jgi:hypothetical protein
MKVLITGIDGYSGWTLALHLMSRGHEVSGIDNFITRSRVREVGSHSGTPILSMAGRLKAVENLQHKTIEFYRGDLAKWDDVLAVVKKVKPDAIVHLGEQRSAPYSMIDVHHAVETQCKNVASTLHILYAMKEVIPDAHLVKMGTMGEYGTPNTDIPEGFFEIEYMGRKDRLPFPRQSQSWYHWSKVFDSGDVMMASRIWGLSATDVMQGVIYGTRTPEITSRELMTRFDFDEVWGTALNRFCVQAILGLPMTPYGKGGQKRGYIALEDSMQSLTLALENPADKGEYRVFNQFDAAYTVSELAELVKKVAKSKFDIDATIQNTYNPRVEKEEHYYNPHHENLLKLGYRARRTLEDSLVEILKDLKHYRSRLEARRNVVMPRMDFRTSDNKKSLNMKE